jgi:phosphoribosylglycinamide formyltransferase 1
VKIGVLASHEGTTLQALLDACASGSVPARVALVISNNSGSGALRRAAAADVPALHLSGTAHPDPAELDAAIRDALVAARVDVVFLAGYMKKLGPLVLETFAGRLLNTHPALLPKFGGTGMYGMNVHRAVLAAGERESGPSVHLVDGDYDTGAVVEQRRVAVLPGDTPETLAARVQECERELVVDVFRALASGARPLPCVPGEG